MATINPYLNFPGTTENAFNFYKSIFGGEFITLQRFRDVPGTENLPEADRGKIMHIALSIGDAQIMATDALESMGQKLHTGNNFYISFNAASRAEADKIFNGLAEGGSIEMTLEDTFWGSYYGALKDKYQTQWMVSFDEKTK